MNILDIKISEYTKEQALDKVVKFLDFNQQFKIFTPNPEMLVFAQKDKYFKQVLNSGDLNICDGRGIELVSKGKLKRITGVDFMLTICKLAAQQSKSIYLLGSNDNFVLKKAVEQLKKQFPGLQISGYHKGPLIKVNNNRLLIDNNQEIINKVNSCKPDILFVAFGHNKQEKWIYENLKSLPSVKIAMGVGGSFEYISGQVKRAPQWIRKIGLEWLYRLIKEPKRLKRIWQATVVFLWCFLTKKIS